jgi:hypothetical protein
MSAARAAAPHAWAIEEPPPPPPPACGFCGRSSQEIAATGRGASREFLYSYQLAAWCCLKCLDRRTSAETRKAPLFVTSRSQVPEVSKVSMEIRDVSLEAGGKRGAASEDPDLTTARALALGIRAPLGESFRFRLFGRVERAELHPTRAGFWVYRSKSGEYGLGELRGLIAYGRPGKLTGLEQSRWMERLDYEAGLREPREVVLAIPQDASRAAKIVAEGIALFLGLRDATHWPLHEPFTFARDFNMAWCQVSSDVAKRGIREVHALGLIEQLGKSGKGPKAPYLWRLPPQASADDSGETEE